jgi:hypothetical protein
MKLYRYELYCDDEPQNVGFIVGLNDLIDGKIISDMQAEMLLDPFDAELPFPICDEKDAICLFTEFGQLVFCNAIDNIVNAYEGSIFNVKKIIIELPDDEKNKLEYEDKFQVCMKTKLFKRLASEYEQNAKFAA